MKSLSILLFAALALGGRAQEGPASPLTLADALQRAAAQNPGLAAQDHAGRAAGALVEQAGLRPNPTLDVTLENFAGTGRARGVDGLEATVQASQTFERGHKREKRVAAAEGERNIATGELAVRRADVLAATAVAYVETLASQQRLALADEPLQLARETLTAVEARVKAGAASPAESARASAALAAAQAEYARSQAALVTARAALAAQWGGRADDVPPLGGRLRLPDSLPAEDALLAGLTRHPRLELQQAIIASHRTALELAQAQAAQDVTVGAGVRFLREGSDAAFVAGVSVPLPVRNRNQGNIRAARETLAGAEQTVRAVELELRGAFTAAWQEFAAAHAAARNLRRDALPATEEAHAIVRRAYEEGHLPLIDVLDAQRALVALRRELLEVETACIVALARAEGLAHPTFPATTAALSSP